MMNNTIKFNCNRSISIMTIEQLMNGESIKNIRVWNKNRTLNRERIIELVKFYKNNYKEYNGDIKFRGNIILGKLDDCHYILDGQHRYKACELLLKKLNYDFKSVMVSIEIIDCGSTSELLMREFIDINKAVPVPLMYIEPSVIVQSAVAILAAEYPKLVKNYIQTACKPRIDIETMCSSIIKNDIVNKYNIKSPNELIELIKKINENYSINWKTFARFYNKNDYNKLMKWHTICAKGGGLFIGMFPSHDLMWTYNTE